MRTLCELTENPARDIVEGRVQLPTVATVPWHDTYVAPEPTAAQRVDADLARMFQAAAQAVPSAPKARPASTGRPLREAMDIFRASNPGEFTSEQCAAFCLALGWHVQSVIQGVNYRLNHMARRGVVARVGMINARHGRQVIWRFTSKAEQISAPTGTACQNQSASGGVPERAAAGNQPKSGTMHKSHRRASAQVGCFTHEPQKLEVRS